jgi:DNA polymerase I-like protein with 3'-5' exonuclease and polymerase domains
MIGPEGSKFAVVRDQPTAEERDTGLAFSTWNTKVYKDCLIHAGTSNIQCWTGFIAPRPHKSGKFSGYYEDSRSTFPSEELKVYIAKFIKWFEEVKPNCVMAVGEHVLQILTGETNLDNFRGYIIPSNISTKHTAKVIATYLPSRLIYESHHMFTTTMDIKKGLAASATNTFPTISKNLIPSATPDQFIDYCNWIIESTNSGVVKDKRYPDADEVLGGIGLDIENTIGHGKHITQFGIGHSGNYAMTINFLKGKSPALTESDELRVWKALARLSRSKAQFIAHNGIHDLCVTWLNNHILFKISFDTMLMGQLLYPELLKSLKFLCSLCLDVKPWKHISGEENYNPEDVANTRKLKDILWNRLQARDLVDIFNRETKQIPISAMLQLQGLKVDKKKQERITRRYSKFVRKLKELLDKESIKACGEVINYNSPKQVSKLLYVDLGLPSQHKRRKSIKDKQKTTTDQEALITLCQKTNNIIPRLMIKHRKASKALSTYLDFEPSPEGTIHSSWNIGSTVERFKQSASADSKALGRWSCSASIILPYGPGNQQSIPEYARSMYVPFEEGWEIGCGDYVQAEAVIVAYLSKDEPLIKLILRGNGLRDALRHETNPRYIEIIKKKLKEVDIHRTKAMELFNVSSPFLVTSDQRYIGKQTRHATNYISGPRVLQAFAAQGEIYHPIAYWKNLMAIDKMKAPAKYRWHQSITDELSENKRILSNPFGRRRKFLGEWNEDLFKAGCAFKPQSTIGDLLNEGMVDFYDKWVGEIRLLLQLHDGMYISYPKNERAKWLNRLRKSMEIEIEVNGRTIVVDIEMKAGPSWGELKDVNF